MTAVRVPAEGRGVLATGLLEGGVGSLTLERMARWIHEPFQAWDPRETRVGLGRGARECHLELILAVALSRHVAGFQEKFSLVFRSVHDVALPQGICRLKHPGMGELDLFLTPIMSRVGRGLQYEAIVNREQPPVSRQGPRVDERRTESSQDRPTTN